MDSVGFKKLMIVALLAAVGLCMTAAVHAQSEANAPPESANADNAASAEKVLVNLECPMPGYEGEPVRADKFVDIDGRRVYVCCGKCQAKLSRAPEQYEKQIEQVYAYSSAWVTQADLAAGTLPMFDPFAAAAAATPDVPASEQSPAEAAGASADERVERAHDNHDDHDHAAPEGAGIVLRLVAWLGKLHPASVNFPVAMLIAAAFCELLMVTSRRIFFENAGRFCLWVGGIGALVAATLGWFWGGFQLVDSSNVLTAHRWLGTLTALVALGALVVGEVSHQQQSQSARGAYRVLIALAALLVAANAFLGGAVGYGLDYYLEF